MVIRTALVNGSAFSSHAFSSSCSALVDPIAAGGRRVHPSRCPFALSVRRMAG
jgi:hypothetical protein